MTPEPPAFSPRWWEEHYQSEGVGHAGPSPQLTEALRGLRPGAALEAGCGNGADAVWLAQQGWLVTAVDVSATAVAAARQRVTRDAPEAGSRITWVVADLTAWHPPHQYDLVVSQYVHPDEPFGAFVARLAEAVAPGGTLFVAGHDHADSHSSAHAAAHATTDTSTDTSIDASIDAGSVTAVLAQDLWEVQVAETRHREAGHGPPQVELRDVVVNARRTHG